MGKQANLAVLKVVNGIVPKIAAVEFRETETGEIETIRTINGEKKRSATPHFLPFKGSIEVDPADGKVCCVFFGLKHAPEANIKITLAEDDKGKSIGFSLNSTYSETREYQDTESRYVRSIRAGEEVAPYCHATADEDIYEDVSVTKTGVFTEHESRTGDLKDPGIFYQVYALLKFAPQKNAEKMLAFLTRRFPEEAARAQNELKSCLAATAEQYKKEALALTQLSELALSGFEFPKKAANGD